MHAPLFQSQEVYLTVILMALTDTCSYKWYSVVRDSPPGSTSDTSSPSRYLFCSPVLQWKSVTRPFGVSGRGTWVKFLFFDMYCWLFTTSQILQLSFIWSRPCTLLLDAAIKYISTRHPVIASPLMPFASENCGDLHIIYLDPFYTPCRCDYLHDGLFGIVIPKFMALNLIA